MATYTFDELLNGVESTEIFDGMIAGLKASDFPIDDWNDGAPQKTMLEAWSLALSRFSKGSIPNIMKGGFIKLAPASWVPVIAENVYGILPFPATYTKGKLRFTVGAGFGPYTIRAGQSTVQTLDRLRYFSNNVAAPITISSAAPVWVPFIAESPGSKYNVLESTINSLATSMPGVTVENVPEPPALTWIDEYGNDAETTAQIIQRCLARMGRLSKLQNYPEDGYISLVRDLVPQVKKVTVFTNFYQGTARPGCATLFLAGDSGPVSAAIVAQVLAAIRPYRNPLGTIFADSCTVANIFIDGVAEVEPDFNFLAVRSSINAQLLAYQQLAQIGAKIYQAEIIERVMTPLGVTNFKPLRLTDTQLGRNQVVNFIPRLDLSPVR
jgi:hypothetical protein